MDYRIKGHLARVFKSFIADYNQPKNDYNYDSLSKNHLPSSQKDFGGYSNKNYNDYPSYGNKYGSRDIPSKNTY